MCVAPELPLFNKIVIQKLYLTSGLREVTNGFFVSDLPVVSPRKLRQPTVFRDGERKVERPEAERRGVESYPLFNARPLR